VSEVDPAATLLPPEAGDSNGKAESMLRDLREALDWEAPRGERSARVEADARYLEGDGRLTAVSSPSGDLLYRMDAPLSSTSWADGRRAVAIDRTGMPRPLEGQDLELARLLAAILTGTWLATGSAVRIESSEADGDVVLVRVDGGRLVARLLRDGPLGRPLAFEVESLRGTERFELEYGDGPAPWVPARVRHRLRDIPISEYRRTAVAHAPSGAALGLVEPEVSIPRDVSFDASSHAVRAVRANSGQLLVEAEVAGETGWFVLDTGASATVVASGWPSRELPRIGESPLVSAYSVAPAAVRRASSLRVGPATIRDLPVVEMDLAFLSEPLGRPVAGIVGYDLFARAFARIDSAAAEVSLEPPSGAPSAAPWIPFRFESKLPVVEARWEPMGTGDFRIDLGASPGVIFHWPVVERHRLLEGRDGEQVPVGSQSLLAASIDDFELGGARSSGVIALFAQGPGAILGDRYTDGNIGVGILDRYRILLDYRRARMALLPRPETESQ